MTAVTDFSPQGYENLISSLKSNGYEVISYPDADPNRRHLIVRHDVDFSLRAAVEMAQRERASGFSSTYFVLLRTEFYNPFSREGLQSLQEISALGHDIGLHFDAALYSGDIEQAAARECAVLESLIGRPVTAMSFHRPAPDRVGEADRIAGRLNAYGPRFVRDMGYCSDSRGAWNHGMPLDNAAVRQGRALQLLIHPFWWQSPAMTPQERLRKFLQDRERFLDQELARHCTVHNARG